MQMKIESRHLEDVVVVLPEVFQDSRGFFCETFRRDQFEALGLPTTFVQDNHSRSVKGVVRGLHFQWEPPMGKLMRVTVGAAFRNGGSLIFAKDLLPHSATGWASRPRRRIAARCGLLRDLPGGSALFPMLQKFNTSAPAFTATKASPAFGGTILQSGSIGPCAM